MQVNTIHEWTIKKEDIKIMAWRWNTSRAWGHEAVITTPGHYELGRARVRYYNRTWERWTFQSAIGCAIEKYADKLYNERAEELREAQGGRLKRGQAETIRKEIIDREDIKALRRFYETGSTEAEG